MRWKKSKAGEIHPVYILLITMFTYNILWVSIRWVRNHILGVEDTWRWVKGVVMRAKRQRAYYIRIISNHLPRRRKYNVHQGSLIDPPQAPTGVIKKFSHVNALNDRPRLIYIHIYLVNNIIRFTCGWT